MEIFMSRYIIPGNIHLTISSKIRKARLKMDMSQQALADKVYLDRTSIVHIESGRQSISIEKLYTFALALEKSITYFLPKNILKK
jgi:transcriptional regulator with XRE-family HTH domain